jgi:uncharacterized protein YbaA (DUF1428 family)
MSYVDGFVIPVPDGKREAYREMAANAAVIFREHGALHVVEAWGNDVPEGKVTDFYGAVKCEKGENVVFSWITWPSKEARDVGQKKAMEDPRMTFPEGDAPFNPQRMIWGGFEVIVEAGSK